MGFPVDVPMPSSMEDLVAGINLLIAKDASPEIMVQYLQNYKNDDWKKYATWDPYRYTRNLIEEIEGKYSLILLCWPESNASAIHDHPNSDCIMKCLSGTVKETRFSWPDKKKLKMTETGYTVGTEGDVIHINDDLGLHRVENPSSSEGAVTLHFYFPCIHECLVFDEETGKARRVKMTYTSIRGVKQTPQQKVLRAAECK